MFQTLGQTVRLNLKHLTIELLATGIVLGQEGQRIECAIEMPRVQRLGNLHFDDCVLGARLVDAERGVALAFEVEQLDVYIGHDEFLLQRETVRFRQQTPVFGDEGFTGKDQVGRRLAKSGRGIHVSREGASRLLGHQLTQVGVLANRLGRGREVEDDTCTIQCQLRRGRLWYPEILTNLNAEFHAIDLEGEVDTEVGGLSGYVNLLLGDARA